MSSINHCVFCLQEISGEGIEIVMKIKMFYNCKPTKFPGESEYPVVSEVKDDNYDQNSCQHDAPEIMQFIVALVVNDSGEPRIEERKFKLFFCHQEHARLFNDNLHAKVEQILQGNFPFVITFEGAIFPVPKMN